MEDEVGQMKAPLLKYTGYCYCIFEFIIIQNKPHMLGE